MKKKLMAALLATAMVLSATACGSKEAAPAAPAAPAATEEKAEEAAPAETPAGQTEVDYYCNIGAYLNTLNAEIDNYNATKGVEEGVYINLISNIDSYSTDLEALMQAGTHYDLLDCYSSNMHWVANGWVKDLNEVAADDAAVADRIAYSKDQLVLGNNILSDGFIVCMPLETRTIKFAINTDIFEKNNLEAPKTWDDVVECAKVITENGNGEEFGFGWSTWSGCISRLTLQGVAGSVENLYYDPSTETWDFSGYEQIMGYMKTMYENGWMLGADDLGVDEIRAQFSAGKVGMWIACSYDYAVFTDQFPAVCNWDVIEYPSITGEKPYKELYLFAPGTSIDKVAYEGADDVKKDAIRKAWLFLNSKELNSVIYAKAGMIPSDASIIAETTVDPSVGPQWAKFATGLADLVPFPNDPAKVSPLEGDNFNVVLKEYMQGYHTWDEACKDLNERYNAATQACKEAGDVDFATYSYGWSHTK